MLSHTQLAESEFVPPQSVAPRKRLDYPELDGLRFCAFLAVFCFHGTHMIPERGSALADLSNAGAYGLPLFFLLSSYLITQVLLAEKEFTGRVALKAFYARRALRIWPLYLIFLITNFIAGLFITTLHIEPSRFAAFLLMAGNWYVGTFGFGTSPIYPLWSISVEEQFYLIWPALAGRGSRLLLFGSLALVPISLATIYALHRSSHTADNIWTNSIADCLFFAVGSLLAIYEWQVRKAKAVGVAIILLGFASWWPIEHICHLKAGHASDLLFTCGYLLVAASCAIILFGFRCLPGYLFPRWARYPGKISYGMYVFHRFGLNEGHHLTGHSRNPAITLIGGFILTALLASGSYKWLEKPFLRMKRRFEVVDTSRSV